MTNAEHIGTVDSGRMSEEELKALVAYIKGTGVGSNTILDQRSTDILEVAEILNRIFPERVWDDGVVQTAERWLRAMEEFSPSEEEPFKFTTFEAKVNQLIVVKDIQFSSLCAHHLFPYAGVCHVGYIPNELQVGLSKIPRLVHWLSEKPSVQENLTNEIASYLKHKLRAHGVAVVIEATHTCMACRGVKERSASMRTSEMRGVFLTAPAARQEFMEMIK